MIASNKHVVVTIRIPGQWSTVEELTSKLPMGYSIVGDQFLHPHGLFLEFADLRPDRDFAYVFKTAAAREPKRREETAISKYRMNAVLQGTTEDVRDAWQMMRAASAIVRAGGNGTFIDNCGRAHGASDWMELTHAGAPHALLWAFVNVAKNSSELYTIGMHILGQPDIVIEDISGNQETNDRIQMLQVEAVMSPWLMKDGACLEEFGFQLQWEAQSRFSQSSPMHNPYGVWRLIDLKR